MVSWRRRLIGGVRVRVRVRRRRRRREEGVVESADLSTA